MTRALRIAGCVAGALTLAASAQSGRRVAVPEWAGAAVCTLATADGKNRRSVSLNALPCPGADAILSCDFPAAEPLDLPLGRACVVSELPVVRATAVRFEVESGSAARVEWLESSNDGPVSVLATREAAASGAVLVARNKSRYLRVTPVESSPVTLQTTQLPIDRPWRVPVLQGGELIVHVADAVVRPSTYRISGPLSRQGPLQADLLTTFPGLPPGIYDVTPVYAGGRAGKPLRAEVERAVSTVVSHAVQPVGAIAISAAPETCARTTDVRVWGPEGMQSLPHRGNCDQLVAGLAPGEHSVELLARGGPVIPRKVVVTAQEVAPVHIVAETASVSGRVTLNGNPVDGMAVLLRRERVTTVELPVRGGVFGGDAGEPGNYRAVLRDSRRLDVAEPTAERGVTLAAGANVIDWDVEGGVLVVNLRNWDRTVRANLYIVGIGGNFGGEDIPIQPTGDPDVRIVGLPVGKFAVSATDQSRPRRRLAPRVPFELTKEKPEAEVTLTLEESPVTLVLGDAAGRPIRTREIARSEEITDGVYAMATLPGQPIILNVRGYAPACRIARADRPIEVTLVPGRMMEVHSPAINSTTPFWSMIPPGSDCPILLGVLQPRVLPPTADGMGRLLFESFPASGSISVIFATGSPGQVVDIPSSGPLILRPPGR